MAGQQRECFHLVGESWGYGPAPVHSGPRSLHTWKEENPIIVGIVLCECQPGHSCTDLLHANSFPIQPYMLTNLSSGLPPAAGPAAGLPLDAGLSRAPFIPVTSVSWIWSYIIVHTDRGCRFPVDWSPGHLAFIRWVSSWLRYYFSSFPSNISVCLYVKQVSFKRHMIGFCFSFQPMWQS